MKRTLLLTTFIATLMTPTNVFASDKAFTHVEARGKGCPQGSTDIVTSPDGSAVSILFTEMNIELPQFDGENDNDVDVDGHGRGNRFNKNLNQKVCNIIVESDLPNDHKVDSLEVSVDFRGSTYMDPHTTAFFHSQLMNLTGPGRRSERRSDFVARKIWREGPTDEEWTISKTRNIRIDSACSRHGDSKSRFNLRNIVRASITKKGQRNDSFVFIGLDSADLLGTMKIKVNTSPCRGRVGRPDRPTRPGKDPRVGNPGRKPPVRGPIGRPGRGPGVGRGHCPAGTIFHAPARRCMTKREIVLFTRRG